MKRRRRRRAKDFIKLFNRINIMCSKNKTN